MTTEEYINRFKKRTKIINDHWIWMGARNPKSNHGEVSVDNKLLSLSRFIFCKVHELNYKDYTFLVCHKQDCNIPYCWNPEHLYKGTPASNTNDVVALGYHPEAKKTHCPRGHEYKLYGRTMPNNKRKCMICTRLRDRNRVRKTVNGRRYTVPGTRKL